MGVPELCQKERKKNHPVCFTMPDLSESLIFLSLLCSTSFEIRGFSDSGRNIPLYTA